MGVFVCEDGPADRTSKDRDDDYYGDERGVQEVDVKV